MHNKDQLGFEIRREKPPTEPNSSVDLKSNLFKNSG